MFGLGMGELIVIAIVALLFVGPDKLPDAAKAIGKGIRDFRRQTHDLQRTIEQDTEIGDAVRELRNAFNGVDYRPDERPGNGAAALAGAGAAGGASATGGAAKSGAEADGAAAKRDGEADGAAAQGGGQAAGEDARAGGDTGGGGTGGADPDLPTLRAPIGSVPREQPGTQAASGADSSGDGAPAPVAKKPAHG